MYQDADIAVRTLLGRNRPVRKPVVRGAEGGFAPHGVEFQQVGEGIERSLRVAETEAAVDDVAQVVLREADFQPAVARCLDNPLGVERTGEIDGQVANRNVLAVFEAERRNEACEEQLGAGAVDFEIAHARKIERDALEAFVVVADELVLLDCLIGPQAEAAAGQDELPGAGRRTMLQCGPHGGHGVGFGCAGREKIFQVDDLFGGRSRTYRQAGQQGRATVA